MLKSQTIDAEEYEHTIPLFLAENPFGSVHSLFQNGLNILMGERLLFIGTDKNGKLPFGIHLQKEAVQSLLPSIQMPAAVQWNEETKQLTFENSDIAICFKKGTRYSNVIHFTENEISTQYLETFIKVLAIEGEKTGLDLEIDQFLLDYFRIQIENTPSANSIINEVYRLIASISSNHASEIDRVIRYFLGRGKGLTPSGDDHLVGLLAIHTITGVCSPLFLQTLQTIIQHESVTTDIAREYLLYALKGEFSSTIINILNSLVEKERQSEVETQLIQLLTVGHSSGVDTAFGLLIGILAVKNWRKE